MSITLADIIALSDSYIGDNTVLSTTQQEKYNFASEASVWLIENTMNEHGLKSYNLKFIPGISKYRTTASMPDMFEPASVRRSQANGGWAGTRKAVREIYDEIASTVPTEDFSYAIERDSGDTYLLINTGDNQTTPSPVLYLSNLTSDGVTFSNVGNATSTITSGNDGGDTMPFGPDTSALNDGIQWNIATGSNTFSGLNMTLGTTQDLSAYRNYGLFTIAVYIPSLDTFSGASLIIRSQNSSSLTMSTTLQAGDQRLAVGWNIFAFDATLGARAGSATDILNGVTSIEFRLNHLNSQPSLNGLIITQLNVSIPEWMNVKYLSQYIGKDGSGNNLFTFANTTDVPFFSGTYDHYRYSVAHKMSELIFRHLRLNNEADRELREATTSLTSKQKAFPQSITKEDRTFKVRGHSFTRRKF